MRNQTNKLILYIESLYCWFEKIYYSFLNIRLLMRETGVIVSEEQNRATIQLAKGDKCKSCNICTTTEPNRMQLQAINKIDAGVGDTVEVEVPPGRVIGSSFLIFIVPIILMIVGYFVGNSFFGPASGNGEGAGIIGSILGFLFSLILLKLIDSQIGQKTEMAFVINKINN
jgi:sigma-E factor negative regulatory protein RseC